VPALLASLLLSALAVAADDTRNPLDATSAARTAGSTESLYQVRCWQYGRLLFEEREVQLTSDIAAGLKLRASDRNKLLVYVTDTGNATCLIRGTPARK